MTDARPLVYVVDDEEPVRKALSRLLSASGLRVDTFSSGTAFLDAARLKAPDCAVLDLHMPGLTGVDVLQKMTGAGLNVPAIVITAHDAPESKAQCMAAGAIEYLCKPIDAGALLDAIARVARTSA